MKKANIIKTYIVKKLLYILFIAGNINLAHAQSYYVGQNFFLNGPSLNGSAAWTCDEDNVSVSGDMNGARASIISYFSGTATITCTYVYTYYIGTKKHYSNSEHLYFQISCNPSTLTLNKKEVKLKPGQEVKLSYTNSSGYDLPFVHWSTSDRKIADFDGYKEVHGESTVTITAKEVGECVITCEGNTGKTAPTCKVTVMADPPTAISVSPATLTLQEGSTGSFTYKLTPEDAYTKVTWSSSNESVATVSSSGIVTAVSEGTATITATTDNGLSASGSVEIIPQPRQVSLSGNQQIAIGYLYKLEPTLTPANAMTTYKWESSDSKIASIDESGRVRGKTAGEVTITVTTANEKSASCRITVKEPSKGMDHRNAGVRTKSLKELVKKSLNKIK